MTDSVNLPAKLVLFGGGKKFLLISIIIPDLIGQFSIKSFFLYNWYRCHLAEAVSLFNSAWQRKGII